jgi:hypothetical protein
MNPNPSPNQSSTIPKMTAEAEDADVVVGVWLAVAV